MSSDIRKPGLYWALVRTARVAVWEPVEIVRGVHGETWLDMLGLPRDYLETAERDILEWGPEIVRYAKEVPNA